MKIPLSLLAAISSLTLVSCSSSTSTLPANPVIAGTNKILYLDIGTPVGNRIMTVRLVDRDGSNIRQLDTAGPIGSSGHRVFWTHYLRELDAMIFYADSNGDNRHAIDPKFNPDDGLTSATVSPDGNYLAYQLLNGSRQDLVLQSVEGSTKRILATDASGFAPIAFSPDGQSIVYYSNPMDTVLRTLRIVSITGGPSREVVSVGDIGEIPALEWSMKNKIVYADRSTLNIIRSDGGGLTRLGEGRFASWSPSGDQLAFCSSDFELMLRSEFDSTTTKLPVIAGLQIFSPQWSPDGKYLLVAAANSPNGSVQSSDLYEVSVAGGTPRKVAPHALRGYYVK